MFDILLHMVEGDQSRRGRRYDSFRETEHVDPRGPQPEEWLSGYPSGRGEPDASGPQWADVRPATYQVPTEYDTQRDQPRAGERPPPDDRSDPGGWPSAGSQTGRHSTPVPGTRSLRKPQASAFPTDDTSHRKPIITPISELLGPETTAEPPSLTPIFPSMAPSPPPVDPTPPPRGRSSVPTRRPYSSPPAARYSSPPAARYSSPPADQYSAPRPGRYAPPPAEQYDMPRAGQPTPPPAEPYGAPRAGQYPAASEQYDMPRAGQHSSPPAEPYPARSEQYGAPQAGQYASSPPEQYRPAAEQYRPPAQAEYGRAAESRAYPAPAGDAYDSFDRPGNGYQAGASAATYATPPASGYGTPSSNGYATSPEAGNFRAPESGYAEPRATGYAPAPPANGYPAAPANGYPAQPGSSSPPPARGYATPRSDAYTAPPATNGYAQAPPANGYPQAPPANGYPQAPPTNGYAQAPPANGYASGPAAGHAAPLAESGYFDESGAGHRPASAEPPWAQDGYQTVQPSASRTAQSGRRSAPDTRPRSAPPEAPRSPATAGGYQTGGYQAGGYRTPQLSDPRRPSARGSRANDTGNGRSNRWVAAMTAIAVVVVIAVIAVSAYFITKDDSAGTAPGPDASTSNNVSGRDLSSRDVDPDPLTEAEVFPSEQVSPAANETPYAVLKKQASDDCRTAAADELGTLLADAGCSQVIRATLKHPNGKYLVTTGLFNLADQASADQAHDGIKPTVDAQKGRFTVMAAGAGTEAIVRAPTQLGWNVRGHYLAYCVIARADGQPFAADDQFPQQIIFDLIETYLGDQVIGARAAAPAPADPGDTPNPADPDASLPAG